MINAPGKNSQILKLHSRIFAAAVLLQKVFPSKFSSPNMMQVILDVKATGTEASKSQINPPEAAFVARMLADALNEDSILERLFDYQMRTHSFPEAEGIIWHAEFNDQLPGYNTSTNLTVYSSVHWLKGMELILNFQSNAYRDSAPVMMTS
jgi:hypothetical protein